MDYTGISGVDDLAHIADLVPEMDEGTWPWEPVGRQGLRFVLIRRGREDAMYSTHESEAEALARLAASVSEGSHHFYEGSSFVVDSAERTVLVVEGVRSDGLATRRR